MTTIIEILAEAFNRVKAEHGVTLSRVEYVDAGGVLGLNFKAAGSAATRGNYGDGELVKMTPEQLADIVKPRVPDYTSVGFWTAETCAVSHGDNHNPSRPAHTVDPNDCTHVGSVGVYYDCYWKFERGVLYLWDGSGVWNHYDSGESAQCTVGSQLEPVNGYEIPKAPSSDQSVPRVPPEAKPDSATHIYDNRYWVKIVDGMPLFYYIDQWAQLYNPDPARLTPINPS